VGTISSKSLFGANVEAVLETVEHHLAKGEAAIIEQRLLIARLRQRGQFGGALLAMLLLITGATSALWRMFRDRCAAKHRVE